MKFAKSELIEYQVTTQVILIVIGQVKAVTCDADNLSHWLTSYRDQLKASSALSSLPDVVHQQLYEFMVIRLQFIIIIIILFAHMIQS